MKGKIRFMKTKTIIYDICDAENFDKEVNELLENDWDLVEKRVIPGCRLDEGTFKNAFLVAFFERYDD